MGVFIKFFGTIMELMIPWILSYILDNVVPTKDRRMIFFWGIMMIVCSLAAVVGNILANRVAASVARDTTRSVRHDLFKRFPTYPAVRSTIFRSRRWNPV